jgi:hypothetical protein
MCPILDVGVSIPGSSIISEMISGWYVIPRLVEAIIG